MGMVTLFTVTAPARSGTKWFSDLFTTDRSFCYHELTTDIHPSPSNRALKDWMGEQICLGRCNMRSPGKGDSQGELL